MKPLQDYAFIRGVCYSWGGDQATIERDLGYAQRLQLNSTRIWLRYQSYWEDPAGFIQKLRNYVRTAHARDISTMPILWSGNMVDVALKLVEEALADDNRPFLHKRRSTDDLLEAAEYCANLLEGSEMVPMIDPPSARILAWRGQPEEERDGEAIRAFAYELAQVLKRCTQVL
jgi:hypothetical protein